MNKRKVIAAAKRAGYEVLDTWSGWIPNPGENVRQYDVTFRDIAGKFDPETMDFESAAAAVEHFEYLQQRAEDRTDDHE